jgi:hypothetical protein
MTTTEHCKTDDHIRTAGKKQWWTISTPLFNFTGSRQSDRKDEDVLSMSREQPAFKEHQLYCFVFD